MKGPRTAWIVGVRELGGYFLSPVAYVVGALFLGLQGVSFWMLVRVLSDPRQPAPYGAVLQTYFGGTTIYWAVLFALIAALTMHLCAEERRRGTWELLYTAGASEAGVIAGKHLAALAVYGLLWLPTLSYLIVLDRYAPPGAGFELGPIAGAYLGVMLVGAAAVGLGLAASAASSRQIVAALATFTLAMIGLLLGELGDLGGGGGFGLLASRQHMAELAGGLVRLEIVASYIGAAIVFALVAHALSAIGRRRWREILRRGSLAIAAAALVIPASILAGRTGASIDLTARRVHSLEAETAAALERIREPVDVLVIRPAVAGFAELFHQVDGVLERMARRQPLLRVRDLDPASVGEHVAELSREFAVAPEQLRDGGAVVIQSGGRRRLVDFLAMAELDADALGAASLASFDAEAELAAALAAVTDPRRPIVCRSNTAGEVGFDETPDDLDWAAVRARLRADAIQIRELGAAADIPAECDAVLVAGPTRPLSAATAAAIGAFVEAGGGLVVAARSQPARGSARPRDAPVSSWCSPSTASPSATRSSSTRAPRSKVCRMSGGPSTATPTTRSARRCAAARRPCGRRRAG